MVPPQKDNDKRYENDDKRSFFACKRSFGGVKTLPLPGKAWHHLAVIAIYIIYEVLVSWTNGIHFGWKHYLPFYTVFILLFYFYAHSCYPMAYAFRRSKPLTISILILCFALAVAGTVAVNHINRFILTGELSLRTHPQTLINASWRSVTLLTLSGVYWLFLNMAEQNRKTIAMIRKQQEMERRELKLKIAYENARINPHFLFNTLQFIYKEVERLSPVAEEAVSNLAEIMRYSLAPMSSDGKVPLADEIRMVELFIAMVRQRFGSSCYLSYDKVIDDMCTGLRIPPHTILTVAENMAKHGLLTDGSKQAYLALRCNDGTLEIMALNHKPAYAKKGTEGMGLQNLVSRLDYFYPDRYDLDEWHDTDMYNLIISIAL